MSIGYNGRVYGVGPITGCSYAGCTSWRKYAARVLAEHGIEFLDPMRAKDYLMRERVVADNYPATVLSCGKGITTRDFWDCHRADFILANLTEATQVSIGSVMEIAWAYDARVPIVLAMANGSLHDHAMIRECAGFIVPTLDQAIDVVIGCMEVPKL